MDADTAVRVDVAARLLKVLERARLLPQVAYALRVLINAICAEEIRRCDGDTQRRQAVHGFVDSVSGLGGACHIRIHFVVRRHDAHSGTIIRVHACIVAPVRRPSRGRGGLRGDVRVENISLRVGVARRERWSECLRPEHRGRSDRDAAAGNHGAGGCRFAAVGRVVDERAGCGAGDDHILRGGEKAAVHAEHRIRDEAGHRCDGVL